MNKFISLLKNFFNSLSFDERQGIGAGTIAALIVTTILLTSCTQETYIEDLEPVVTTEEAPQCLNGDTLTEPHMLDNFEPETFYTFTEYCNGYDAQEYEILFHEDGSGFVALPSQGQVVPMPFYFNTQTGVLFIHYESGNTQSFQLTGSGDLVGADFGSGCTFIVHLD